MSKLLRDVSREGWLMGKDGPTDAEIQSGSQQRIADALERLAIGKTELETQKELQEAQQELRLARSLMFAYKKSVVAYKGVITKLKKRLES